MISHLQNKNTITWEKTNLSALHDNTQSTVHFGICSKPQGQDHWVNSRHLEEVSQGWKLHTGMIQMRVNWNRDVLFPFWHIPANPESHPEP